MPVLSEVEADSGMMRVSWIIVFAVLMVLSKETVIFSKNSKNTGNFNDTQENW